MRAIILFCHHKTMCITIMCDYDCLCVCHNSFAVKMIKARDQSLIMSGGLGYNWGGPRKYFASLGGNPWKYLITLGGFTKIFGHSRGSMKNVLCKIHKRCGSAKNNWRWEQGPRKISALRIALPSHLNPGPPPIINDRSLMCLKA